jgi:hypothetical protein
VCHCFPAGDAKNGSGLDAAAMAQIASFVGVDLNL